MVPPAKRLRKSVDKRSSHPAQFRQTPAQGTVEVCQLKPVVDELVHEAMRNYTAEMEERMKAQDARIAEQEARLSEQAKALTVYEKLLAKHDVWIEGRDELIIDNSGDIQQLTKKVDEFQDWIWERFMNFQRATDNAILRTDHMIFRVFEALMTLSMTVSMRLMS
ncbi:MAG: hypothetical protein OHK93_000717 [Ramalina farinacea]|uniref:Uncharacterized protein n=1 Tax=Ramalina farinacea TaxID=258253 RepID=A0AA43TS33_9LECA|nr:hypothetical protein [Ramalina farinacea]